MCAILTYARTDVSEDFFETMLSRTQSRGPDMSDHIRLDAGWMGFNRLSIMGPEPTGMQPFRFKKNAVVCNGEIYGYEHLKQYLISMGYDFRSGSDCEILLPLYEILGTAMFRMLDAEYACVIYDAEKNDFIAARDPIGIRPLYYGYDEQGHIAFASEPKNLIRVVREIMPFPPGHFYSDGAFTCYRDMTAVEPCYLEENKKAKADPDWSDELGLERICSGIRSRLIRGIEKRLTADQPIGFLLSGGLDSSLVCGVAARLWDQRPIETFAIGMETDAIDLKYAKEVAEYIHSNHHEVIITKEQVLEALEPVIRSLATYDITTIRASVGMYLICQWIRENTDIRVLLTGEISDELFGYKYTDFAPDAEAFQKESEKRIRELHMYDVLRADRCISVHGLEARVPFGDLDFVSYVMGIEPERKINTYGKGKYLLRHAFEKDDLIPYDILMREKAAFSDAVGHSLRDDLMELAEQTYTDEAFEAGCKKYTHATPFTKESLMYRDIFEKYYPGQSQMVVDFWMPNREWEGCNVNDPSARVLSNYGDSGK